jgi:hypothetical protein
MQICVHDVFSIRFSSFTCYDTVLCYDTNFISFFINCCAALNFCLYETHDTTYNISFMASLKQETSASRPTFPIHLAEPKQNGRRRPREAEDELRARS